MELASRKRVPEGLSACLATHRLCLWLSAAKEGSEKYQQRVLFNNIASLQVRRASLSQTTGPKSQNQHLTFGQTTAEEGCLSSLLLGYRRLGEGDPAGGNVCACRRRGGPVSREAIPPTRPLERACCPSPPVPGDRGVASTGACISSSSP